MVISTTVGSQTKGTTQDDCINGHARAIAAPEILGGAIANASKEHFLYHQVTPTRHFHGEHHMQPKVTRYLLITLLILILLALAWIWLTLNWSYSEGERAGYVQKLSKKGWICKTWEGEIAMVTMPGAIPEKFQFTVRDDALAGQINMLAGKRVVLSYQQHKFIPSSCFGETEYFVGGVREIAGEQPLLAPAVSQGLLPAPR